MYHGQIKRFVVGVMGPGSTATPEEISNAEKIGYLLAEEGLWILTGGSNTGVMNAALKGAKDFEVEYDEMTVTIGILSHKGEPENTSEYADILIPTGMGEGRNYLNILTSNFIVVCCDDFGSSPGTMTEVVFAIKHKKPIVFLYTNVNNDNHYHEYYSNFLKLFPVEYKHSKQALTNNPEHALKYIKDWINIM